MLAAVSGALLPVTLARRYKYKLDKLTCTWLAHLCMSERSTFCTVWFLQLYITHETRE